MLLLKRRCKKTQGTNTNTMKTKQDAKMFLTYVFLYVHFHAFIICPSTGSVSSDQRSTGDVDEVKLKSTVLSNSLTIYLPTV